MAGWNRMEQANTLEKVLYAYQVSYRGVLVLP
jgi:hypothetical protein